MRVLGVDGCPGGWVGALVDAGQLTWHAGSFTQLLRLGAEIVAVDIPIGLPAGAARRDADLAARRLLGPARSSVFFAPPRIVLEATSQPDATRLSRAAGSVGVSIQTFYILAKIAEVDVVVRPGRTPVAVEGVPSGTPAAPAAPSGAPVVPSRAPQVVEIHPEVSFRRLAQLQLDPGAELPPGAFPDAVTLAGKRSARGQERRLNLLRSWLPGVGLPVPPPGRAAIDDCLDAAVAAWSGARWATADADVLGYERDALGVPMRIIV